MLNICGGKLITPTNGKDQSTYLCSKKQATFVGKAIMWSGWDLHPKKPSQELKRTRSKPVCFIYDHYYDLRVTQCELHNTSIGTLTNSWL